MEVVVLNNGVKMPVIGLGTHGISNNDLSAVIDRAFHLGYRKFDTAWLYQNEHIIGDSIKRYSIPRHELFLTSKLHIDNLYFKGYHRNFPNFRVRSVKKAFEGSCRRLGTDYIDLYLLHWAFPKYEKLWDELVELYLNGRIRAIGVCSFLPSHIDVLKSYSDIVPAVNQYEMTPLNTLDALTKFMHESKIHTEAYSLFGTTKQNEHASIAILENSIVTQLASKYNKTPSQIILRWAVQRGFSVIPRSKSEIHLKENLDIFDFNLLDGEIALINSLNKDLYNRGNPNINYYG